MIINLISGPRNVSTALMYAFAQRSDTVVTDEPFYAVYLRKSGADHPGKENVLNTMSQEETQVRSTLLNNRRKPVLFIKNMAHHMEVLDEPFIDDAVNTFLIRDPAQILASYSAVVAQPVMRDIGVAYQHTLFTSLVQAGKDPIVLDSGELLKDPASVLAALCLRCGIPYEQRMVHWSPGPKPYDGVWAPYWYDNVHRTTGFQPPPQHTRPVPQHLEKLYHEALTYYEKLFPFSLKA